ncbi:MAG: carboxypeptidase regulatory-like domain-containing protein, partial [Streptosporangiaceae bacterium]
MRTSRFLLTVSLAASLAATLLGAAAPGALAAAAQAAAGASAMAAAGPGSGAAGGSRQLGPAAVHLLAGTVRGPGGRAIGGVCVTAAGTAGPSFAVTSADGRYELSVARAGKYAIEFRACQSAARYLVARTTAIAAGPVTALQPVTMRPATAAQARQAALAALGVTVPRRNISRTGGAFARPGVRGEPQGTVTGKVTSPSGRPLAGICVDLTTSWGGVGSSTAKNGSYRIVAPSGYSYRAEFTSSCSGFFPTGPWAPEWYNDKFASAPAVVLRVRTGKTISGIDAVMRHQGQVTGTVSGASGHKLKGICILLTTPKGNEVNQTVTTADGSYRIPGLDPGGYRVLFLPGCGGQASDYASAWWPNAASLGKAQPVRVKLGRVTRDINGKLTKLGSISGEVRLVSKSGKPIRGMCVWAYSPTNVFEDLPLTSSRPDGSYLLQGIPAGRYGVGVNPGCNNNGNYTTAYYPARIKVTDGKTVTGINIYLQPGGIVSGTVTDAATGKPLSGICVGAEAGGAVTRANGQFRIDQLAAGQVTVEFLGGCGSTGSFAPQWYPGVSSQGAAVSLRITPGHDTARIDAAMLPGAVITGQVTSPSGTKLSNVCVSVRSPGYLSLPYSDVGADTITANGAYAVPDLAAGTYSVVFY